MKLLTLAIHTPVAVSRQSAAFTRGIFGLVLSRRRSIWATAIIVCAHWLAFNAQAQLPPPPFPLSVDQNAFLYKTSSNYTVHTPPLINWQSKRGVPISTNSSDYGSDGRAPTVGQQINDGTNYPTAAASPGQFRGFVNISALAVQKSSTGLNTNASFAQNVQTLNWPRLQTNNTVVAILRASQVGAPYLSKQPSLLFGSIIPPPLTAEDGKTSVTNNPNYWLAAPFSPGGTNLGYYYSPYANEVFATQPGQVKVIWEKSVPTNAQPTGLPPFVGWTQSGPNYFLLYTNAYLVSGEAVKTPQTMYWTEGSRSASGHPVIVPPAVTPNFIYNVNFPQNVPAPGDTGSFVNPSNATSTLWMDSYHQIRADNLSGRAFMELVGPRNADGTIPFLGFEIVDVYSDPAPSDVTVELGTRIPAYQDRRDDSALFVSPPQNETQFYYRQSIPNSSSVTLWATYETTNLNDFEAYWLIPGVAGLQWPYLFDRYHEYWPSDIGEYVNYVRPYATNDLQASLTAVQLPTGEAVSIPYQDDPNNPRAHLLANNLFYTHLDPTFPAHRTLLQFLSGDNVAYERVFSWLDANVQSTNFAGSIATNLTGVAQYPANLAQYQTNYAQYLTNLAQYPTAYSNYLAALPRGVNGTWQLLYLGANGISGSVASCSVIVQSTDANGILYTNEFDGPGFSIFPTSFYPYGNVVQVTGITNRVIDVQLVYNGLSCNDPQLFLPLAESPVGSALLMNTFLLYGGNPDVNAAPVTSITLGFDDFSNHSLDPSVPLASGTYKPTFNSVANMLLPAPVQPAFPTPPQQPTLWANQSIAPRVVNAPANVGDRIYAPNGELGAMSNYLAGYILQASGNSFNPGDYLDPFLFGFTPANQSAIIPVNAIPGNNMLEVWWFRQDNANVSQGFQQSYWPAVIGRYTLQWPTGADEIILASKAGSGHLGSIQAKGSIYRQSDPTQPGYNPNEEQAVMFGDQAYALHDDLNITNAGPNYSSQPYVLIDYMDSDGRPAMHAFHVRREKPEAGILFDYVVNAGTFLQAPMPLPLLPAPVAGVGSNATNYNSEPTNALGDLPALPNSLPAYYGQFTFQDRLNEFWVYRGLHSGLPPLVVGAYDSVSNTFDSLPAATAVIGQPFAYYPHVSRLLASGSLSMVLTNFSGPNLPSDFQLVVENDSAGGPLAYAIMGTPGPNDLGSYTNSLVTEDTGDNSIVTNTFVLNVVTNGIETALAPLAITSSNQYSGLMVTFSNRPPFLAQSPVPSNSFTMRFYYKNEATFDWPGWTNPPVGAIVPYLLPYGSGIDPTSSNSLSLDIVYRPVWPTIVNGSPIPKLFSGQTLTDPINGLAQVRGQSSVQVLYQQSMATNTSTTADNHSVTLFDPTVQKTSSLLAQGLTNGLPASVYSTFYQGRYYFPNLPPNLVNRIFFDPNTTNLVLQGQYVNDTVGSPYLLLNVLSGSDLAAVENLCPSSDTANHPLWLGIVTNLSDQLTMFDLDTNGIYRLDTTLTETNYVSDLVAITNSDQQVDSYAMSANGSGLGYITFITANTLNPTHAGDPITVYIARVAPPLYSGELKVLQDPNPLSEAITFLHSDDLAGKTQNYQYDWRITPPVDGQPPTNDISSWQPLVQGNDIAHFTFGASSGIQSLSDNYVALRYREIDPLANPANTNWSPWTTPALAEGYIKRVLQGINPFDQRTTDLFDNPVNTTGSIISQAGHRWEGDVALNASTITNAGLIEIYETLLHRGEALSINAGYNYGPANDALLLAAGYLSDLYSFVANDALADEANPTIGIGTSDKTYGDIATALFAFQGQEPSLLEEELALLRGRDDSLSPGVRLAPVYNRLYWNYTYGIAAGEVIYALNYNILDENNDGVVNAKDAAILYPMGHGDAYGHLLTALGNYYSLLMNTNFDWVPQIETVTVLGAAVSVNYEHERKFAATAGSLANTGLRIFDLTWREGYRPGTSGGWSYFDATQSNGNTYSNLFGGISPVTKYWGMDHWAARTAQGAYLNWVVGNAILPAVDPDPSHQGIQKVDRTTVTDLGQLPQTVAQLQTDMDNAEAGFTPFDVPQNAIPFDINPLQVTGTNPQTHFEQVYQRAVVALNNAVTAFNDAQNVTQLMRSEEDSLSDFQAGVTSQELAYNNELIELYGTPYLDDMGPGKTYSQDYNGPDLLHYTYVETPDTNDYNGILPNPSVGQTFNLDVQYLPPDWSTNMYTNVNFLVESTDPSYTNNPSLSVPFYVGPDGFFDKPPSWKSQRSSPGQIQQAISTVVAAQHALRQAAYNAIYDKMGLDKAMNVFSNQIAAEAYTVSLGNSNLQLNTTINDVNTAYNIADKWIQYGVGIDADLISMVESGVDELIGASLDLGKLAKEPAFLAINIVKWAALAVDSTQYTVTQGVIDSAMDNINKNSIAIANSQLDNDTKNAVLDIGAQEVTLTGDITTISQDLRTVSDAQAAYQALVAKGQRIQSDRQTFRQHAAALVQGYRTRDAAFRLFQNEKLQRYLTLFDLAAKYSYLAAQAYDYETGLLGTPQGQAFLNQIISAQALGVVNDAGEPQYSSSSEGDPGLAGALAQMDGDWAVLKGRLGFNNPDGYGTTVSLRSENYRILPNTNGDSAWQAVLQRGRVADLLADSDVRRNCLQIDDGSGTPVPGIILSFSTTIANGQNLFGNLLAAGDHNFSPSSFATKIFAAGVCFDGYIGMDNPAVGGGTTPPDPTLDPNALAATPYVYLIPVGQDSMRSPPLGDASTIRSWSVDDIAIPLPFNVSASDFSSNPFYTSASSLSEPLFAVREHQAFRPVSTTSVFNTSIYGANGALQPSQYTNNRLIGRSIWNSKWKLVIPGRTLLADPNQGLDSFIQTVKDVHLYFITYSYSGN